jgi:hypothetical protein
MKPRVHYPWSKVPEGGSFFVPTLAPFKTKEAGLKAALHHRVLAKATFGLKDGKHGVLFTRRPAVRRDTASPSQSSDA